jgi:thiosulfate/3-mercaptopyruvate sulfurtransferase
MAAEAADESRNITPPSSHLDPIMPFSTLISTNELAARLNDANLRVFDCRHLLTDVEYGRREYAQTHIPGAVFVHLDHDLSTPPNGKNGRHALPSADWLAAKFGALGIDAGKQVICYDDAGGAIAGRMWWSLRWLGQDAVALLDGGITKWIKEGHQTTEAVTPVTPTKFTPHPKPSFVDAQYVLSSLRTPGVMVVDARANDRFHGQNETVDPVGGHIPGAINRFFKDNLVADGTFKPAAQLREEFERLLKGLPPSAVVNQCGSGVTACHNLLAMEIAGLSGARLYPGSWSEWITDRSRPVAT